MEYIIYGALTISVIFTTCIAFMYINKIISENTKFLYTLNGLKQSELRNRFYSAHRMKILKQNKLLMKLIKSTIFVILILTSSLIVYSCSSVNEKNINELRSEFELKFDKQDSTINSINIIVDSLEQQVIVRDSTIINLQEINKTLESSNTNLKNIVWHQNTMIKNLQNK